MADTIPYRSWIFQNVLMIFLHCIKQRVSYQYCVRTSTIRKQWMVRCIFYDQFNIYKICTIDIVDHNVASVVAHVWVNISRCRTYVPSSSTDSTPYVSRQFFLEIIVSYYWPIFWFAPIKVGLTKLIFQDPHGRLHAPTDHPCLHNLL